MNINNENTNATTQIDNKQKDSENNFFILMTLEDEKGQNKQIKIYKDSDPSELAFEFCKVNNLDFNSLKFIKTNIKETKKQFFEKEEAKNHIVNISNSKDELGKNEKKKSENILTNPPNLEKKNEKSKNLTYNKNKLNNKKEKENLNKLKNVNKRESSNNNFIFGEAYINDRGEKIWVSEQINNNTEEGDELSELTKLKNSTEINSVNLVGFGDNYISQKDDDFNIIKNETNSLVTKSINSFNSSNIRKTIKYKKKETAKNLKNSNSKNNTYNKKKCIVKNNKTSQNLKHYQTINGDTLSYNNENIIDYNKIMNNTQKLYKKEINKEFESINKSNYFSPYRFSDTNSQNKDSSNYYQITQNIIPKKGKKFYPLTKTKYNSFQKTRMHDPIKNAQKETQKVILKLHELSEPLNCRYDENLLIQKSSTNSDKNHYVKTENSNNSIRDKKILNDSNKLELLNNNSMNIKNNNTIFNNEENSSIKLKKKCQKCRISSYKTCKHIGDSTPFRSELCLSNKIKLDNFKNRLYNSNIKENSNNSINYPSRSLNVCNKFNKINKNDNNSKGGFFGSRSHSIFINTPNNKFISPMNFCNYTIKDNNNKTQNFASSVKNDNNNLSTIPSKDNKNRTCRISNNKNIARICNVKCNYLKKTQINIKRNSLTTKTKITNSININQKQNSNENLNKTSKLVIKPMDNKVDEPIKFSITSISECKKIQKVEKSATTVKEYYSKSSNSQKVNLEKNNNENILKPEEKSNIEEKIKQILKNLNNKDYFKKNDVFNKKNDNTKNIVEKIFSQLDRDSDGIIHLNKNKIYEYFNILFPEQIKGAFKSIIDLLFTENKKNVITKNCEQVLTMDITSFFNYIFLIIYILSFED